MSLGDMIFTVRAGANVGRFYRRPGYLFGYPVRRPDNCYRHHRNRGDQKGGIAGTATSQTFSPTTLTRSSSFHPLRYLLRYLPRGGTRCRTVVSDRQATHLRELWSG